MNWENVYVFISSTFNDMHAERDYLIKDVFPTLAEWCEAHYLRLIDIDLRWGVTEADANENKNTVKICMERIDECRPFFLCFLGQRRGWVPEAQDVSQDTLLEYPELKDCVGRESVTEMEILHALYSPFNKNGVPMKAVEHALFFLRESDYLRDIPREPAQLYETYTNDGIKDPQERGQADDALQSWRDKVCRDERTAAFRYTAGWDNTERTPELMLPLSPDSGEVEDIQSWQRLWQSIDIPKEEYNRLISTGRLSSFRSGGEELSALIIRQMKQAIERRFPTHFAAHEEETPENRRQQEFLFAAMQGYVERPHCFDELDHYADSDSAKLFVLFAPAGMGKSMLLANWIVKQREAGEPVFARFTGTGLSNVGALLQSLVDEITKKYELPQPQGVDARERFARLLQSLDGKKIIVVLDGLNQLSSGLADLSWLPVSLPPGVKLIASIKSGGQDADACLRALQAQGAKLSPVSPFEAQQEREELANAYLSQYLKGLDQKHLKALTQMGGTQNPLFLKIILSELRTFGSFRTLMEHIKSGYGSTPESAFFHVLERLEGQPAYTPVPPAVSVPLVFSLLACARRGLPAAQMAQCVQMAQPAYSLAQCLQTVNLLMRQMRSYLVRSEDRIDFLYESLNNAAAKRYKSHAVHTHTLLARMFRLHADPAGDGSFDTGELQPLAQLPYHLHESEQTEEFIRLMTDIRYLDARCALHDIYPLLEDFEYGALLGNGDAKVLSGFLKQHAQKLLAHTNLFFSLLRHEGVAQGATDALLAQGGYKKPWISTTPVPIHTDYLQTQDNAMGDVGIFASFSFDMARIGALSGDARIAFYMEKLGVLRMIDAGAARLFDRTVSVSPSRPLVMASSHAGTQIAIAYENGSIECHNVFFENGAPQYAQKEWDGVYYLPEYEDPVLLYAGDALYYQREEGILTAASPSGMRDWEIAHGEVSGICPLGKDLLVTLRQGTDTAVFLLHSTTTKQYPNMDVFCTTPIDAGQAAVSFSDGATIIFDETLREAAQQKSEKPAVILAACGGSMAGFGDNLHMQYQWDTETGVLLQSDTTGVFLSKGQRVRPLGLHCAEDESILLTDSGLFRYAQSAGQRQQYTINFAAALAEGDVFYSLRESQSRHWLARASTRKDSLYTTENNLILRPVMDHNDYVLVANPVGGGVIVQPDSMAVCATDRVPAGLAGIAGSNAEGFFLAQRTGDVLFLAGDGAVTRAFNAAKAGVKAASVSIHSFAGLFVWCGVLIDASPGIDAELPATLLRFFREEEGCLTEIGTRVLGKREGEVRAMTCADGVLYLCVYVDGEGTFLHTGSVREFVQRAEQKNKLSTGAVLEVAYSGGLYLRGSRAVYAVEPQTGKTLATLEADLPFTALCDNRFHPRSLVLIQDERALFLAVLHRAASR
ncbi:DUF4062 domain-containing protein [Christensenellaceae bacterium OttesenSCG-928-K19]|nr:DUF4062 domain-containing protein [Christensenellaceae bacterium OttesenSCG-928-K19]